MHASHAVRGTENIGLADCGRCAHRKAATAMEAAAERALSQEWRQRQHAANPGSARQYSGGAFHDRGRHGISDRAKRKGLAVKGKADRR